MYKCIKPELFEENVDEWIEQYEEKKEDDTLSEVVSESVEEELEKLYGYKTALKNKDYAFIRAQGFFVIGNEERNDLADKVFLNTFGGGFSFTKNTGSKRYKGLFEKAEFVNGGVRVHYRHEEKSYSYTFSLTTGERSTNKGNSFINIPGFRDYLNNLENAENDLRALTLALGSKPESDFILSEKDIEESYIHGNIESMKAMLKNLHELGGEKADYDELEGHLNLLDRMKPEFFNKLKLYVKKEAEESKGVTRPSRIDIKIKGAPASIGNQQSEASIYVEEVVHSMNNAAINSGSIKSQQLLRRLDHLVELGRKQVKIEHFLPDPKDSIDPVKEQQFAEKLYDYIFNNENTRHEFLAKGIAQPLVAKALSTVKVRDTSGEKTILDRLYDLWDFVQEILLGEVKIKNRKQSVHDALVQLAFELAEINTEASRKTIEGPGFIGRMYDLIINDTDRKLSRALHNIGKSYIDPLSKKEFEKMPDDLYGRIKVGSKIVALSLVNPVYTKVAGAIASAYNIKPDSTIREVISGLFPTEPVKKVAEFLVLASGTVDRKRNDQIGLVRDSVLYMFKTPPSRAEEEAMTEVLADTALASLFGKTTSAFDRRIVKNRIYDNATIRKILTDEDTLDKYILETKRALKDINSTHYEWHKNQAVGLGIYLATHQATTEQNANASNIAEGIMSNHKKQASPELIKAIEELATLTAIKNTDVAPKEIVANLMKKEYEGVQHVADVIEGFRKNSIETMFKENQRQMVMGYTRQVFDDTIVIEIAPLKEKEKMEASGFQLKSKLVPKVGDGRETTMGLYVTDTASRPERVRGATRLNQIRSMGQTISKANYAEFGYEEGEGMSTSLIRERSARDINKIQRASRARIKKMEEGEYDFGESIFGLMPLINEQGKVVDYRYMMDKKTKKEILKQDTRISEVMGRSFGSLLDKERSAAHNIEVLKVLSEDMKDNWKKGTKGVDGLTDFTLIGPEVADKEMRKLYYMLPKEFRDFIQLREDKTLAVRTELMNVYFGYTSASIAQFPMLKSITPEFIKRVVSFAEMIWMETVQIIKTNILIKMPTVAISNFVSNVLYLALKGYYPPEILRLQVESFRAIKSYNSNVKRKQELLNREREIKVSLSRKTLSEERTKDLKTELIKVKGELTSLNVAIKSSRINELVEMGLDQSVEDISTNVVRDTNRVSNFFDERLEKLPGVARTGIDYLFLTKRTVPHQVMSEFLNIADLMSRDIQNTMEKRSAIKQVNGQEDLPIWWLETKEKGYKPRQKLTGEERVEFLKKAEEVRKYELVEDYINYALPSSRFEEYLNKIGILMFTKYIKRIQRIIAKTGSRGPLKSLIGLLGISVVSGLPSIHEQSFLAKEWYTESLGPGNVVPFYNPVEGLMNVITPPLLKESTYSL